MLVGLLPRGDPDVEFVLGLSVNVDLLDVVMGDVNVDGHIGDSSKKWGGGLALPGNSSGAYSLVTAETSALMVTLSRLSIECFTRIFAT